MNKFKKVACSAIVAGSLVGVTNLAQAKEVDFSSNMVNGQYQKCLIIALEPYMDMLKNNILWANQTLGDLDNSAAATPSAEDQLDLQVDQDRLIASIDGLKVSTDVSADNDGVGDGYTSYYYEIKFEDLEDDDGHAGHPCGILSEHTVTLYAHPLNWNATNAVIAMRDVLFNAPSVFYMNSSVPGFALQGGSKDGWNASAPSSGVCKLDNANIALFNKFGIQKTFNVGAPHTAAAATMDPSVCGASIVTETNVSDTQ